MTARYGMLECGKNFKGTLSESCSVCCCIDDEEHRLNVCPKYDFNYRDHSVQIKFATIFSSNIDDLKLIIPRIATVWNVKTSHGSLSTSIN